MRSALVQTAAPGFSCSSPAVPPTAARHAPNPHPLAPPRPSLFPCLHRNHYSRYNCRQRMPLLPSIPNRIRAQPPASAASFGPMGLSLSRHNRRSGGAAAASNKGMAGLAWGLARRESKEGGARAGGTSPLRGLTPWSEDAQTDPDPEPYIRATRRAAAATRDRQPPPYDQDHDNHHRQSSPTSSAPPTPLPATAATAADVIGGGSSTPAFSVAVLLRRGVVDFALPALAGSVVGYGLGLGAQAVGVAAVAGVLGRVVIRSLAETVPFTGRRHHLLLPVPLELMMGEASFRRFLAEQRGAGKVLSRRSREHLLVAEVAQQVIATAMRGYGGGSTAHLKRFRWEVVTVADDSANAFVLPGGKVVVHTGLLRLLGGRRELLATVLGHEVAHALARHSAEKMTLGFLTALALRLLAAAAARAAPQAADSAPSSYTGRKQRQRELEREREGYGRGGAKKGVYDSTHATGPYAGWPLPPPPPPQQQQQGRHASHPHPPPPLFFGGNGDSGSEAGGDGEDDTDYSLGPGSLVSALLEGAGASAQAAAREYARQAAAGSAYAARGAPSPPPPPARLGPGHPLLSPQVAEMVNELLLQLPFSRRAESEADLIGLKLMALSGYDPAWAPETFRLLEAAEHGKRGGGLAALAPSALGRAASLGCTHPRSANRVKALEAEVRAMQEAGPQGYEQVYTHPSYWSL